MSATGTVRAWRTWHQPTGHDDGLDWCYEAYDGHTKWFGRIDTESKAIQAAQQSLDRIVSLAALRSQCTGLSTGPSPPSPNTGTPSSTPS